VRSLDNDRIETEMTGRKAPVLFRGADDEGFLPPNKQAAFYEKAVAKALAKALVCVAKGQQARAAGKLADATAVRSEQLLATDDGLD
jgi:hypothetical protein